MVSASCMVGITEIRMDSYIKVRLEELRRISSCQVWNINIKEMLCRNSTVRSWPDPYSKWTEVWVIIVNGYKWSGCDIIYQRKQHLKPMDSHNSGMLLSTPYLYSTYSPAFYPQNEIIFDHTPLAVRLHPRSHPTSCYGQQRNTSWDIQLGI